MPANPWEPRMLQTLIEKIPVGIARIDEPDILAAVNPAFTSMTGVGASEIGRPLRTLPRTEATEEARRAVEDALKHRRAIAVRGVRLTGRSGQEGRVVDIEVVPASGEDGEKGHLLVLLTDVTERAKDHARARLFYESFLTSSNPIEVTDKEGVLVDVNPAFEKVYGYRRAECVGKSPNLVRSKQTPVAVYEQLWRDIKDPKKGYWSGEITNKDRKGKDRPVFLTVTAIRDESDEVTHYLGVAVDLSEQRAWQRQAAHADKLASLGQLAAGVAHEINTPLANVILITESIRRRSSDPWVKTRVESIAGQVEVAAKIVRGLLDFARRSEPQITALDLDKVVKEAVEFVRGKQTPEVELVESYPAGPIPIRGDRGQIIQVITNVLNNAYDAIGGPGSIRLEVRRRNASAEVEIIDSGPGIPPEMLSHIFEPFFTTKPEGEGTGLGLAICHGIMQSHHGSIEARNASPKGASFVLTFPLNDGASVRG